MVALQRDGDVFVLDLGEDENRLDPARIEAVDEAVQEVERAAGPRALVTTGSGRFYSNGLEPHRLEGAEEDRRRYLAAVHRLYGRVLTAPLVTVAAVQGHAYGGGAMLALAHDVRVMRVDRGFWCLPESALGLAFTRGMAALVQGRLDPRTAQEAMVLGRRYGGDEAREAGVVDATASQPDVLGDAVALAAAHAAKAGDALGTSKQRMHAAVTALLDADPLA